MTFEEKAGLSVLGLGFLAVLGTIAFWGGVAYVVVHFIHKLW